MWADQMIAVIVGTSTQANLLPTRIVIFKSCRHPDGPSALIYRIADWPRPAGPDSLIVFIIEIFVIDQGFSFGLDLG